MNKFNRNDTEFFSKGVTCRAWHYQPSPEQPSDADGAMLVMAHGLGGTRDAGLDPFAERFAANGYHVLLFDYRYFGASDGEPRQLLSIGKQLDDWQAAVAYSRTLPGVNPKRVILWGTSFSGGHVLATAANDPKIAAVVAQNPMVDGFAAAMAMVSYGGLGQLLRLAAYGLADQIRALFGLSPVTVPLVAKPGEFAAMSSHDALSGYLAIAPDEFRNEMTARMAVSLMTYRPTTKAEAIQCPVLIQASIRDTVAPAPAALKLAEKLGSRATEKRYDIGHFDIYLGEHRETALVDQLEFFGKALNLAARH